MLELMRQRRSIRKFAQQPVEEEKVTLLTEALLRAPTSRSRQPCTFILVDDRQLLERLAAAKPHGTSFFSTAPLAVVIAADPAVSDVWIEDSAVAATFVQLAAESLGLKSCWAQLRLRQHDDDLSAVEYVRQVTGLPPEMEVPMVIAIGHPAEEKAGHAGNSLLHERIHRNRYQGEKT